MRVAINQPYYYPYAGYFRLFAASDLFVILDDVQWNRRGRVHRCQAKGKWITLPIKKTNRDTTRIMDLEWQKDREKPISPMDLIIGTMEEMCKMIGLHFNTKRSSELNINGGTHGQDRIIAICKKLAATHYINSPGGRDLYDEAAFAKEGIKLEFLPKYNGGMDSIIERLASENPDDIRREIYENL